MKVSELAKPLEELYQRFNSKNLISPDPLEWVYKFKGQSNQEIAALLSSSLAYGNVTQILASLAKIFSILGSNPHEFITQSKPSELKKSFKGFKHRWHTGDDISGLLLALAHIYAEHGSLLNFFMRHYSKDESHLLGAMDHFVSDIKKLAPHDIRENLLSNPTKKSACKRLHMFLRWMVRYDAVDTGLWRVIPASKLIMPIDTHIHQISLAIGLTKRKLANLETAIEITNKFKKIYPEDPVRYDFCLARLGINRSATVQGIRKQFFTTLKSA